MISSYLCLLRVVRRLVLAGIELRVSRVEWPHASSSAVWHLVCLKRARPPPSE